VNLDAVTAAVEIQEAFARVPGPLQQIIVKMGLHRGATIAVTSNRTLDYFGRTVNIAARVQGASEPGELLLSESVLADAPVAPLLAARGIAPVRRSVFSVRPKAA
jgi:class 3 adenylate cyclase